MHMNVERRPRIGDYYYCYGVCDILRITAKAGIPATKYYLSYLGVVSTVPVTGRGGSTNRSFVYVRQSLSDGSRRAGVRGTPRPLYCRHT